MIVQRESTDEHEIGRPEISAEIIEEIKRRYEVEDQVRRGVCLLNAGQFDQARDAFQRALSRGGSTDSIPAYLAASLMGMKQYAKAADRLDDLIRRGDGGNAGLRIRHALALFADGRTDEAIQSLRDAIRDDLENAELHFQLGILLASLERYEEAELRFTQAANIDRSHTESLVNLALCCGVRHAPQEALHHLQQAQRSKPHDARIALLLAQASLAAQQQGYGVHVRADMPDDSASRDEKGLAELARVMEREPDFVEAFLAVPLGGVDERVFLSLEQSLGLALSHQPRNALFHCQLGRVLERLGRRADAIDAGERACELDPKCVHALIQLGKLYLETDRRQDATRRLEQAVRAGAEYADVYFQLGNLYSVQGFVSRARSAYRHALFLNHDYEAASEALAALPVT